MLDNRAKVERVMNDPDKVFRILLGKIWNCFQGWRFWNTLVFKYKLKNNLVLLFPSLDHRSNYYGLLYLEQLLIKTESSSALLLSVDVGVIAASKVFTTHILSADKIKQKQAEQLLCYYSLEPFDKRFFVVSMTDPYDRKNTDKLIGRNGTTIDEIMALGILRLDSYHKEKPPIYYGNDPLILKFLDTKEFAEYES